MKIKCKSKYKKWLEITVETGNSIANKTIFFQKNNKELIEFIADLKDSLSEAEFLLENGGEK